MSQKHKRTITENLTETEINNTLSTIKNMLESLEPKQQHIMAEWIDVWCKYIGFEKRFQPQRLRYYKRGEIVLAHFGYNVGSELGGIHFAVIVENNNNNSNNTVTVVPLSSLEEGKSKDDLHKSEIYLGAVLPGDKISYAMPLQMRNISKLRVIKPKAKGEKAFKISAEQLSEIDNKIKELFTKN